MPSIQAALVTHGAVSTVAGPGVGCLCNLSADPACASALRRVIPAVLHALEVHGASNAAVTGCVCERTWGRRA